MPSSVRQNHTLSLVARVDIQSAFGPTGTEDTCFPPLCFFFRYHIGHSGTVDFTISYYKQLCPGVLCHSGLDEMEDRTATPRLSRLASPTIETTAKVPHSSSPSFPSSSTFNNLDHLDHLDHNMSLEDVKQTPPIHFAADHDLQDTQDARDLKRDAKAATEKEQKMTMIQGIRLYPKAVAWSMALSLLIVMEG